MIVLPDISSGLFVVTNNEPVAVPTPLPLFSTITCVFDEELNDLNTNSNESPSALFVLQSKCIFLSAPFVFNE